MKEKIAQRRVDPVLANSTLNPDRQNEEARGQSKTPPKFEIKAETAAAATPTAAAPTTTTTAAAPEKDSKVTKTPDEIAAKKAQLDADATVFKVENGFDPNDPKVVKAALEREGYVTDFTTDYTSKLGDATIYGGINDLCKDKLDKFNTALAELEKNDAVTAAAVKKSIQKVGGKVPRTQKKNVTNLDKWLVEYGLKGYRRVMVSDHALGCALDINENIPTKQNSHFTPENKKTDVLPFVERVVKMYDADFDLEKTKGVDHMNRLNSFSEYLPRYVAQLVSNGDLVDIWANEETTKKALKAISGKNADAKMILDNWKTFKGWANGTSTKAKAAKGGQLNLVGIVDFHEKFVQMMLDAGWAWGGDFGKNNKDYMHFEDRDAMKKMVKPKAK